MAQWTVQPILRHIHQMVDTQAAKDRTDRGLLQQFATIRDGSAFTALVERHGPLVWNVCRRVLRDRHDAEDAFQATFLVLARQAGHVRKQEAVGSWLYGVAYRTAMSQKRAARRRRVREKQGEAREPEQPAAAASLRELQAMLDEEVARLPAKYRTPFVLCCLEGKSYADAARELGWKEGTVSSRLAEARKRLQVRLTCRGVTLSSVLAAAALCPAGQAVPAALGARTIEGVLLSLAGATAAGLSAQAMILAKGVTKMMSATALKVGAVFLLAVVPLAVGAALLDRPGPAARQQAGAGPQAPRENARLPGPANVRRPKVDRQGDPPPADDKAIVADAEMHVIGLYGPKGLTRNDKRVDVEVRPTAKPVVLVLTSYYTVDWHLRLAPRARVSQIILGGANEQTIEGVPGGVPVVRRFPRDWRDRAHPWFYAYDPKSGEYLEMVRNLNEMTALSVASFQGEYEGTSLVVDGKRGNDYAQTEMKPPAVAPRDLRPDQIVAAAAGAELHAVAIRQPRDPCEPVDVEVRKTAKPVVLALTSFPNSSRSAATWKVKIADGGRLKLVILGGWASEVEGLPAGVPLVDRRRFRSHFLNEREAPGYLASDHRGDTFTYRRMVENLNLMTALPVTSFQGQEVGSSFVIDGIKGREFGQKEIISAHPTLKPEELLEAGKGCELHVVGVQGPKDDGPVNVEVRPTAKPAVLVLTSYSSVLWKLRLAEGAVLKAVILGGWFGQDVEGVPAGTPVVHRTYYRGDGSPRGGGYFWAAVGDSARYRAMARKLNEITGLPVGSFQGAAAGTSFVVDGARGGRFAEKETKPPPARPPSLTPEELLAAAAGCELHYVSVFHSPTESVAVEVGATAKPVVVALASHDPVLWKFKPAGAARVKAVILLGFLRSEIDGLPDHVPVIDRTAASSAFPTTMPKPSTEASTCEWGSVEHRRMMQKLNALTGLPVATCQGETSGTSFVIDGVRGRALGQKEIRPRPPAPRSLGPEELLAAATGAELHVVGTYWSAVGYAGERVAGPAGGVVLVEVRPTDKPVVLVLTSWFSVAWKLKLADRARVQAVILGGGYEQEIEEVPAGVPVVRLPRGGDSFPTYQSNCPEFRRLTQALRKMTGLPVTTFQGAADGISFVVDGIRGRGFAKKPDAPAGKEAEDPLADVADVPAQELRAAGDADKRYYLLGPKKDAKPPAEGYGLLVILPGGDGGADFHPFVKRIYKNALSDQYVAAQLVAPRWTADQQIVWPTKTNPVAKMKFSTEEFVEAVIEDVAKKRKLDRKRVFTLSWSSSGPAAYAASLQDKRSVTGSFVAMSVFNPRFLPPLKGAKGHAYYLYHSPADRVCPYRMAEQAKNSLAANGAKVRLETYEGGHGWRGNVYDDIRNGVDWLEKNREKAGTP
jgi:RNA polymerase sigma factor (sigma-70 family)